MIDVDPFLVLELDFEHFGKMTFFCPSKWLSPMLRLELALVFPEEERMMQHSSVSISLSF